MGGHVAGGRQGDPMRVVVQRVDGARVVVDGEVVGSIEGPGLCVLVGVTHDDTAEIAQRLADKVHDMRLFDADALRDRLPGLDLPAGQGSPRGVGRPMPGCPCWSSASSRSTPRPARAGGPPGSRPRPRPVAEPLVAAFAERLRERGATVAEGRFGAMMRVELVNDGPVTVIVEL